MRCSEPDGSVAVAIVASLRRVAELLSLAAPILKVRMFKIALPILGVSNSVIAEEFYCGQLGFRQKYAYRPNPMNQDPCWMGVVRDGAQLVLSSFAGDGPPGSRNVQIYVEDVAAIRREFQEAGVPDVGELRDQTWGNLEFGILDPDGNRLCFAQDKGS